MAVFQNSNLETRNLMRSNLDMGFMPLVMILLLALITSLGLKEMEIFKLILVIQIRGINEIMGEA